MFIGTEGEGFNIYRGGHNLSQNIHLVYSRTSRYCKHNHEKKSLCYHGVYTPAEGGKKYKKSQVMNGAMKKN